MRCILHIGPHKTGTTSIQTALAGKFGSGSEIVYPESGPGPGHARIAWESLGLNSNVEDPEKLVQIASEYSDKGASTLILSSEEFSKGLFGECRSIKNLANRFDVELVVTLTPLSDRVVSLLFERIKHKETFRVFDTAQLITLCSTSPGLRGDFVTRALTVCKWKRVHFIICDKNKPRILFKSFEDIIGANVGTVRKRNKQYPYFKSIILNELNRYYKKENLLLLRELADDAYGVISNRFPEVENGNFDELPVDLRAHLDQIWNSQVCFLEILSSLGAVSLYK